MQEDKEGKKQSSVAEMINLPPKRHLSLQNQRIFEQPEITSQQASLMTPAMIKMRTDLISQMHQQLTVYNNTSYNFKFPESKFPDVAEGQRNNITYQQKIQIEEEDTFANKLSDLQISQIKERGQFQVRSKSEKAMIPYVWKVNGCMFRGRLKRLQAWQEGLSKCYRLMNFALDNLLEVVPRDLKKLANLPVKFFSLIFGRRKLQAIYSPDYQKEVYKQFWTDIMQNELSNLKNQIGHQFLEQLYLRYEPALYINTEANQNQQIYQAEQNLKKQKVNQYNEKRKNIYQIKQKLRNIEMRFQSNWGKIRKNVISRISTKVEQHSQKMISIQNDEEPLAAELLKKKDQTIMQKFHAQKYLIYVAHVKDGMAKQNISPNIIEAVTSLVTIFSSISFKLTSKQQRLQQIEQKIRSNVQRRHPIRSRSSKYIDSAVNKYYLPIKQQIEQEFESELLNDKKILQNLNPAYVSILKKYINFKRNVNELLAQKIKTMKCVYEPQRVFRTTYILFPPYEVQKSGQYYSLKKKQQLRVNTGTHFWKCSLYFMRLKSWSINCFKFLVGVCWASPLGLRCLFGVDGFVYDEDVDSRTGFKTQVTRVPFLGRFGKVLRGIKKSRNAFQALPDRGLFGKNCSRICNYLQCYFFRLIIVGVIGVLMLYPVAIIIFSIVCFVAILTFWIWVPLCMVLCYLFNILIFQFEISYKPAGCLIRSIPLLSLVILILFYLLRIIFSVLFLLVIAPIACLLLFFYVVFQRSMRFFTDTIMLCLIGCLGRTPSRDTSIARKISGPGMSRNYFYSISQQDVYILTQCALEKLFVEKYIVMTRKKILENTKKYTLMCSFMLKPFGYTNPNINSKKDLITQNTNELVNNFNRKAQQYMARYPSNPRNIRFTQEQIELYFQNCVKIVKNFVEKKKIQDWVFEQKNILQDDYEELTRIIWVQIFNCGEEIFQPIQRIDNRFKLLDEENDDEINQNKGSIMKALEGEIDLEQKIPTFTPAKRSLISHDQPFSFLQQISNVHSGNSEIYLITSLHNPNFLLVPPRNLEELKAYDNYLKNRQLETKPIIIQQ